MINGRYLDTFYCAAHFRLHILKLFIVHICIYLYTYMWIYTIPIYLLIVELTVRRQKKYFVRIFISLAIVLLFNDCFVNDYYYNAIEHPNVLCIYCYGHRYIRSFSSSKVYVISVVVYLVGINRRRLNINIPWKPCK